MCHSQRLGDPPLRPWISIKLDGEVVCAHCTCMAGGGEACSHIGVKLFALETSIKLLKNTACTSMPCEWLRPSAQKIEYAEASSSVRGENSTKSDASPSAEEEPTGVRHQRHLFHLRPLRLQGSKHRLQPLVRSAVSCRSFHRTVKRIFHAQLHISCHSHYGMLCSMITMC